MNAVILQALGSVVMGGANAMGSGGVRQKTPQQKKASAERRAAKDAARKANGGVVGGGGLMCGPNNQSDKPLTDPKSGDAME